MSATVHLYIPSKDIRFIPGEYWNIKPSDRKKLQSESDRIFSEIYDEADEKFGEKDSEEKEIWLNKMLAEKDPLNTGYFSDYKHHWTMELNRCNRKTTGTRNKRIGKAYDRIRKLFSEYIVDKYGKYNQTKFIALDEICYRQGWWFKKKLFRARESIYYAFTKESARKLMLNLFDMKSDDSLEAYKAFNEKMSELEDNTFIFEIAW